MGSATWQPKWWTPEHTSSWDKIKESMQRDWEQTKNDLGVKGTRDLNQGVSDTVKQAAGKEVIPPRSQPNTIDGGQGWNEAEFPLQYGYGAAQHYTKRQWDETVESDLRTEWETHHANPAAGSVARKWDEVKSLIRRGYERALH